MDDLMERLRAASANFDDRAVIDDLLGEAADEIERLRAALRKRYGMMGEDGRIHIVRCEKCGEPLGEDPSRTAPATSSSE